MVKLSSSCKNFILKVCYVNHHLQIQGGAKVTRQSRKIKNFIQTLPVSYPSITVILVHATVTSVTFPWISINQSLVTYL